MRSYEVIDTPTDIFVITEYASDVELFDMIVEQASLSLSPRLSPSLSLSPPPPACRVLHDYKEAYSMIEVAEAAVDEADAVEPTP